MLEGRRAQFVAELATPAAAKRRPATRWTRPSTGWVWYAGWADKIAAVAGSANPVAGPYFNFSTPEPTGVVAVVAPRTRRCSGWSRWSRR